MISVYLLDDRLKMKSANNFSNSVIKPLKEQGGAAGDDAFQWNDGTYSEQH